MSQLFSSGSQSIGVSASTSVLPMNIQDWFPLGWTGWISLLSKGLSRVFSNTTVQNHPFFSAAFFIIQLSHQLILASWMLSFKPAFSLSYTFFKRLFSSSLLSAIRVVPSAYLRLLIFLPAILILACASSSLAFLTMYSAYKLNTVTTYSLDILVSWFGTSLLFHVQF